MESNATPFSSFMPLRSDGSLSCILQQTLSLSHSTSHPPDAALFSSSHGTSLDSTNVTLYYKCEPRIPQTPVPQFPGLKTRIHPGNFQENPSSQSSCITSTHTTPDIYPSTEREDQKIEHKKSVHRKPPHSFGHRTSQYRGVTRHRWTGRWEAHLWDNSCKKEGQARKGRQVYLGGYDNEEKAARAYDLAALKYWGQSAYTNFPLESYCKELEEMANISRQEHVAQLRRKSSGFSRGASMYRGVTRHHQHGRWQARIGRVSGNKDLYLGSFSTQEEAAKAYDLAAIGLRGANAVTNFDISQYSVANIMAGTGVPTQRKHDSAGEEQRSGGNSNNLDSRGGVATDWKPVGQAHMINDAMDVMNGQNPVGQLNDLISIASEGILDPLYLGRSSTDCLPVFASLNDPSGQQLM